jgi:translation initiation factor IF-3
MPPKDDKVIANEAIQASEVRLIGEDKQQVRVMSLNQAMAMGEEQGLDVVLISPGADPPVARLMNASKYRYELEKAEKEGKKKQRESRQDLKELKVRPSTDVHDYEVRLRAAQKFLSKGDKVKVTLQFRGREMQFKEEGHKMFQRFISDLADDGTVETGPLMQGRQMTMIMAPAKATTP